MFSVVIPLYNKEKYIEKAILSVLSQSFTEFELIIINDGSTDKGTEVVKLISDNRIKLIEQTNAGVSATRNKGIALSKFDYIAFLDADDWWAPGFLETMKTLIDRYPQAGIYGCGYFLIKNNQSKEAPIGLTPAFEIGLINYLQVYAQTLCMPLTSISVVIPKYTFKSEKGFSTTLKFGEDFDLWIRIALKYPVAFVNKKLAYYNQDVELSNRAVGNIHQPESHVMWNLEYLSEEERSNKDLKTLLDKLRVYIMFPYYLTTKYHSSAKSELQKVDWAQQPMSIRIKYQAPVTLLKTYFSLLKAGSRLKQKMKRIKASFK